MKKTISDILGGAEVYSKRRRLTLKILCLSVMIFLLGSSTAFAQGSIYGTVTNSDLSTPANGDITFVGYLDNTDEEIRIETSVGAGYDAGNWFDDFQNYLTEAAGNPYDYHFYNSTNSEGFILSGAIPSSSFHEENIALMAITWPSKPTGLVGTAISNSTIVLSWPSVPGLTYHVYRRAGTSNGSYFRLDNLAGNLANPGVSDSFFVDDLVGGFAEYDYLIIAQDGSGNLSPHSDELTVITSAIATPAVNSIDPDSGIFVGGTSITIYGSNFDPAGVSVDIGGSPLTVTNITPFEITGTTSAHAVGVVDITVANTASGLLSVPLLGGFEYQANFAPVLAAIGPQSIDEGLNLNFVITASDPDATIPVLSTSPLPGTATFTDNTDGTGTFDWTPGFAEAGTYDVTFYASDGTEIDSEIVTITVNDAGNQPPVLAAIGSRGTIEGVQLLFGVTATDPDGTFPIMSTSTLPGTATFLDNNDGTGTFDWTPGITNAGIHLVTFYASDGVEIDSEIVTITISDVNMQPVLTAIGVQSIDENLNLNIVITSTDADGTTPTLTTSTLPAGATFLDNGDGTALFDWTPTYYDSGVYNITFYATDQIYTADIDSEEVTITVNNVNQLPALSAIGSKVIAAWNTLSFATGAVDLDGDIPIMASSALPGTATYIDNGNGTGSFDWVTTNLDIGTYFVTFYATDGAFPADIDSEIVTIVIGDGGNQVPVWTALADTFVSEGDNLILNISASDPDGGNLTLTVNTMLNNFTFTDNGNGTGFLSYNPDFGDAGIDTVRFIATDDGSPRLSSILVVEIQTLDENQPPIFAHIGPFGVEIDDTLEFTVEATDLTDTTASRIFLTVQNPPAHSSFIDHGDNTGTFRFAPVAGQQGVLTIRFLATDQGIPSETGIMDVEVTVVLNNYPPVLTHIGPKQVNEGELLTFNLSATDPEGGTPILMVVSPPNNSTFQDFGDGTAQFDFSPSYIQAGLFWVKFRAYDGMAYTDETVIIEVIEAGDQAPYFSYIPNPVIIEGEALADSVVAVDPDLDEVVVTVDVATIPPGLLFNTQPDGVGYFSWTPQFNQSGTYDVTFYATAGILADTAVMTIIVQEFGNHTPELDTIVDYEVRELTNLNFSIHASDVDGVNPVLSSSVLPGTAIFNGGTGIFNWTPTADDSGTYFIWFYATDGDPAYPADIDSQLMSIHVLDTNRVPLFFIAPGQPENVNEGSTIRRVISAWDNDGPAPVLTAYLDGGGALVNNMTFYDSGNGMGVLTFSPDFTQGNNDPTFYYFRFEVLDSVDNSITNVSSTQTMKVYNTPQPPKLIFSDSAWPFTITEGGTISFNVYAINPDGGSSPIFWAENLPANADTTTSIAMHFSFAPDFTQAGAYAVTFWARNTDGLALTSSQVIDINVLEAGNQAPVFTSSLPDTINVFVGTQQVVYLTAVDPDGGIVTFEASDTLTGATLINDGGSAARYVYDPDIADAGQVLPVTFIAKDPSLLSTSALVYFHISTSKRGDSDGSGIYTTNDIVYLIEYIFRGGPAPAPLSAGDADMNGAIEVSDIVYMINFLFKGGPRPPQ